MVLATFLTRDTLWRKRLSGMLNRITLGDCIPVLRHLPAACVDLVLTDPPFIAHYKNRSGQTIANDDNAGWVYPAFAELYRVLRPDRYCISFYGWNKADSFLSAWRKCGFQPVGHFVFVKRYSSYVRFVQMKHEQAYLLIKGSPALPANPPEDVLSWKYTGNRLHPTQKPVSSLMPLIEAFSEPNDIVLYPFAGSGSTGVAARLGQRRFILIEKDAVHYHTARTRLEYPDRVLR